MKEDSRLLTSGRNLKRFQEIVLTESEKQDLLAVFSSFSIAHEESAPDRTLWRSMKVRTKIFRGVGEVGGSYIVCEVVDYSMLPQPEDGKAVKMTFVNFSA
jgi:hypothetical protein